MGKKRKTQGKKKGSLKRRKPWLAPLVIVVAGGSLIGGWIGLRGSDSGHSELAPPGEYVRRETRTPLSPALFVAQTARAYQVAQEIPDVLDQLYCYCQCDKHLGHRSLLSCFTDTHGAT